MKKFDDDFLMFEGHYSKIKESQVLEFRLKAYADVD